MGSARTGIPHLFSAVIAVGVAATILSAGRMFAIHLENKILHAIAPRVFELKKSGTRLSTHCRSRTRRASALRQLGADYSCSGTSGRFFFAVRQQVSKPHL
jgi:hypothetical protein